MRRLPHSPGTKIWFAVIFLLCLGVGTWLSLKKPLWNDEIYTQERAIDQLSYAQIIQVKFVEGNNSPLFYLMQKAVCDLTGFTLPMKWKGEWYLSAPRAQLIMRLAPNIFMSLSVALIFYFFLRYYSYGMGFYALAVTLSTHMIWAYWAEARPYALWIFLTVAQSLLFLRILQSHRPKAKHTVLLSLTHVFLSLSVVLSIGQIFAVGALIFLIKDRKRLWAQKRYATLAKKYFFLMVLPLSICLAYYLFVPASLFRYRVFDPAGLLLANIPMDRILVCLLFLAVAVIFSVRNGAADKVLFPKTLRVNRNRVLCWQGLLYLSLLGLMMIFAVLILVFCKLREIPTQQTISLSDRYFMFLVPIQIIAVSLCSRALWDFFRTKKWMLFNLVVVLGGLLIVRFLRTALSILEIYN